MAFCLMNSLHCASAQDAPKSPPEPAPIAEKSVASGADSEQVKRVQAKLKALGFYSGPLDGSLGEATAGSLRRFQMRAGLEQTGALTPETLQSLESEKAGPVSSVEPDLAEVSTVLPKAHPVERYREMIERSPFSLATPVAAGAEPEPNFTMNLYVLSVARLRYPEGRQSEYVTIKSRADNTTFSLEGNEPNGDGIALVGVEWGEGLKSKVTLKKGAETGTLEFDQANVRGSATAAAGVAAASGGAPSNPAAGAAGVGSVPQIPGGSQPRSLPRPGGGIAQPLTGVARTAAPVPGKTGNLVPPGPNSIRQRIRPIGSSPGAFRQPQQPAPR
jgi:peptidoglycan hydrolase-like protein with peptidoglycan-binding domain